MANVTELTEDWKELQLEISKMREELTMNIYQMEASKTAIYPKEKALEYTTLGLVGEAGEIANKVKKYIRGDKPVDPNELKKELGDVLWYISELARCLGISMDDVAATNLSKLRARQLENKLKGSGDER